MKLKNKLFKGILIGLATLGIVTITSGVYATTDSNGGLTLGLERYRNSNYSYKAIEKVMWKISSYNGDMVNKDRTIYCLKGGPGFGSGSGSSMGEYNTTIERRVYNQYFDMKDSNFYNLVEGSDDYMYRKVLPTGENYNSLVWVLEHSYVPAPSQNVTTEQTKIATEYRKQLLQNAGIPNSKITDDEIDIVQQLAVWNFTNTDIYKVSTAELALALSPSTTYEDLSDIDWDRAEDVNILLDYFITNAKANASTLPVKSLDTNPIKFNYSNSSINSDGTNYILGPYKIEELNENANYSIDAIAYTANGELTYTLLDSNKNVTSKTLKELVGTDFYIAIDKNQNIEGIKFKVKTNVYATKITFWSVANAPLVDQPVAEVVKDIKTYEETTEEFSFDLALRKFITNINGEELVNSNGKYSKEPNIDLTPLINKTGTTAIYKHSKEPVGVSIGDIVIFTLRIYNEGEIDGYASEIVDHLPPQLEFVIDDEENFNASQGWVIDSTLRNPSTKILAKTQIDPEDNLIKAFNGETLDYKEVKIKTRVVQTENIDKVITNTAEITSFTDVNGNVVVDRDSSAKNMVVPSDASLPDYKGNSSNKSILTDSAYFYKGQEDDDDFDKLILQEFDLALRKFITAINDTKVTSRVPVFTNVKDKNGNYIYEHTKEPLEVDTADIVEYTIRIFNEGEISGYAKQVKDNIPEGLQFLPNDSLNKEYRWIMLDEEGNVTQDVSKAKYITTDYLSKEQEKQSGQNLIDAFASDMESPDYRDVKVNFKVSAPSTHSGIITNVAEISDDSDKNGKPVIDKDSTPNNNNEKEDDIDVEHVKLSYFDLALRKFITAVNNTQITNRVPEFKIDENGNYIYEHTKEPIDVENGNIITYTLRIYNEGTKDGYAKQVKDDVPEGLEFLPENELNKEYRWIMLDENGEATEDANKAKFIKTDYLSKEQEDATGRKNLLIKFDKDNMKEPDYKEVKIAFKVTEPNTSDRIIINKAQISDDSDKAGKPVIDIDSTPDKWIEGEDDQDIEKIKVKYFDLALRKWVTQAIMIDNGKETIVETGHKPEDDPEEVVKVEIVESRLNKVVVKFRYKIRVTNEGEIAGYVKEISDYIPDGLRFVQADNPNWKEVDGKVVTDELKDTLLQPGETADVEILLTWINGKNNFGLKINTAEISKDYNDSNTPDIDSTPNNKKPGEDDIDDAPVILTIKTGTTMINNQYILLAGGMLLIVVAGAILIKKYVI